MKNNSNSEEKVKLKTGTKGRPKEVVLKEGKEEKKKTKKKTTYDYEPTRYAGISKKYKCVDGKRVEFMGYRVFVECGNEMKVDKNGMYVSKRKRQTRIVKTEKEARELKGAEYKNSKEDRFKTVTVEQAWDDFFTYLRMREGEDSNAETTIYQYSIHRKHMEAYFGKNRNIEEINTLHFDEFFMNCYKENKYTGTSLGFHTCEKLKSTITMLYKYMSKDPKRYNTNIDVIKNASISKNRSDKEKNFKAVSLTVEQINLLIKCAVEECEDRDAGNLIILALCCLGGMRKGEMCGLKWKDIEDLTPGGKVFIHNNRVAINGKTIEKKTKTNKDRYGACLCNATYMMLLIARNVLEEKFGVIIDNEDYVYTTAAALLRPDKTTPPKSVWRRYEEFCTRSRRRVFNEENIEYGEYRNDEEIMYEKIPYHRVHDLRHSYSTLLIKASEMGINVPFYEVSFSLGHSLKGNMTVSRYFHDDGNRENIRAYWDEVLDLTPMIDYLKRHGVKYRLRKSKN